VSSLLLGIDTATPTTTVALVRVQEDAVSVDVLDERSHRDPRRHGEVLPTLINDVLRGANHAPTDLGGVAVGIGPGAYTGLRVGIATAEALGLALKIPVTGVVTLDALAFASGRSDPFAVVTDARRRQVFVALYRDHRTPDGEATVGAPDVIASALAGRPVLAPPDTPSLPGVHYVPCAPPSASALCGVAVDRRREGLPVEPLTPRYLRLPDITAAGGPKSVL
jgi:tRNA threonylcarbamoyladenosine biosynthesis protein TsaB